MAGAFNVNYPTIDDFQANEVGIIGKTEILWQPLYDYAVYPTAGIGVLPFFQVPQGQGFTSQQVAAATAKTFADTNMTQAGQLPSPQAFWVDGIEVSIEPGSIATANLWADVLPSAFVAVAAATNFPGVNDFLIVAKSGLLQFSIMQKNYYQDGPLTRFPQSVAARYDGALASNSATTGGLATYLPRLAGTPCRFEPGFGIGTMENFNCQLTWPALVATAANNARIGVHLNGWLFRAAQ